MSANDLDKYLELSRNGFAHDSRDMAAWCSTSELLGTRLLRRGFEDRPRARTRVHERNSSIDFTTRPNFAIQF